MTGRGEMGVALGLAAAAAAVNGLGRFAYGLVLPAMRTDLHWSLATAGTVNTVNALGYLVGAVLAAPVLRRFGTRRMTLLGTLVAALALLASASSGVLAVLLTMRLIAGLAAAAAFIGGATLVAQVGHGGHAHRAALLLGVYFAGPGVGIAVSGVTVPASIAAGGWRGAWLTIGGLALLCTVAVAAAVRALPDAPVADQQRGERPPLRVLTPVMIAYGLYGAGYIAYLTFIVALLAGRGFGTAQLSVFWLLLGGTAAAAAFLWPRVVAGRRGTALVLAVTTLGAALPLLVPGAAAAYASAVVFGVAFLAVVTAVTGRARALLPPAGLATGIAVLTVTFATGQSIGPVLAGLLSDSASGVVVGLGAGAVLLAAGTVVSLAQR